MATIDLGKIKMVWRGAYNNSTAYTPDDVVSSGGSSYICILASTGNAVSNGTYWQQMAAKGTDADLLNIASTAQGDIYYNNGSAIARLAPGTANQVLKTGGAGANPSWGTLSSDFVKLAGVDLTGSTATQYDFTQFMDDSVYAGYKIFGRYLFSSSSGSLRAKLLNNTTPYEGSSDYFYAGYQAYRTVNHSSGSAVSGNVDGNGRDYLQIMGWGHNTSYENGFELQIWGKPTTSGERTFFTSRSIGRDGSNPQYVFHDAQGGMLYNSGNTDGIRFYSSSGGSVYLNNFQATIWGMKK